MNYNNLKHSEEFNQLYSDLQLLCIEVKHEYNSLLQKYDKNKASHQILLIQLYRVCKYFDSYLILINEGYGEPAANLIRSIFEAMLWMRWIVIDEENARKYFDFSKGEMARIILSNIGAGNIKPLNIPDPKGFQTLLKDESKNNRLPQWVDLAKETSLMNYYNLFYKMLSAVAHGSYLSNGERLIIKSISPEPDELNIIPYVPLANNFVRDCMLVAKYWILEGRIREVPLIKM